MTLSRTGGFAALTCVATYVMGFALLLTLLDPLGYGTDRVDAAAVAAFIHAQPAVLIAWNTMIYILNALALIVLVVALSMRLRPLLPGWSAVAQAIGLIWGGLVLAAGMVANVAVERAAHLYADDPVAAASLWSVLHAVELGLGGGNEIAGGVWIACISLSAGFASVIARPLAALGLLTGIAGLVTLVSPVGDVAGALFGLGAILWFGAIGVSLIRVPAFAA